MATLVHDDVLDARRSAAACPTVVAQLRPPARASRPATCCFSRAFAILADDDGLPTEPADDRQVELLARASVALARGELAQRRDAYDIGDLDRALPASLRAEDRGAVRVRLRDRRRGRAPSEEAALLDVRPRDRPRLPAPRRRPRRRRPARADRQGARHRPARRHRDAAVHPRPRARPAARREVDLRSLDAAAAEAVCDRIAATGAPEQVRAEARERVGEAKRALERAGSTTSAAACSRSSPTASSSATPDRGRAVGAGLEVFGEDLVGVERDREPLDRLLGVGAAEPVEIGE